MEGHGVGNDGVSPRPALPSDRDANFAQVARLVESVATVFWDFDGVIADTEPLQAQAFVELLEALGHKPEPGFFLEFVGRPEAETWAILIERLRLPDPADVLTARRSQIYLRLATTLRPAWYVSDLLKLASDSGSISVIVSSGNFHHIAVLLDQLGLSDRFIEVSAFIGRDGQRGPSKALRLERLVAAYPGPHLLIEDSLAFVEHGQALGMQTVLIRHGMSVGSTDSYSGPVLTH
jgi:beta-phosphoglucomutase-like phosphatase (HAD superfamily)